MTETNKIICPDCGTEFFLKGNEEIGDILECEECGTEIEIVSLKPLNFKELIEEK